MNKLKAINKLSIILTILLSPLLWRGTGGEVFAQQDSIKLPFAIAHEKKLSSEDITNKKEGTYVTAVPEFSSDPVNGFGYGVEGILYFNGKKSDPLFNYTPYKAKLSLLAFNTTKSQNEIVLGLDMPYIFNSKWRLRMEGIYENDPNMVYFGITEKSLGTLVNPQTGVGYADYNKYKQSLSGNYKNYNLYTEKNDVMMDVSAERSFFESKVRTIVGLRYANIGIVPYGGNSFLENDFLAGRTLGVGRTNIFMLQTGLVYDTRDLESDPSKGVFAEVTNELSLKAWGSEYTFNKAFAQIRVYQRLFPSVFKKVVFAMRGGVATLNGNAPFYEYQEEWSTEGGVYDVVGGRFTLRGYKQSRFVSNYLDFINTELRMRFTQFTLLNQHLAFSAVPFFDMGGVGDTPSHLFGYSANYRYAEGLGLRIAWNVNTILRFDYAISHEDRQFFFQFGHTF
ncbi:MAG: Omp85 family outer membrane protein [Bacteroidia bacterium]